VRITTTSGPKASVEFSRPTPGALLVVRSVPGRVLHPRRRCWSFPRRFLEAAVEEFAQMGFAVMVDGEIQTGRGTNPFALLMASMDGQTWRKVSRVLAEVLDPANGGDVRLHNLLRCTKRIEQEHRRVAS
jgi:hypothetical protein